MQSEYTDEHDRRLRYISGFSGSSGAAIVTLKEAALWTDGRYHLQVRYLTTCIHTVTQPVLITFGLSSAIRKHNDLNSYSS